MDDDGKEDRDDMSDGENQEGFQISDDSRHENPTTDSGMFIFRGADAYAQASSSAAPSTPKRQRIAPPDVPMGLTKEDFHKIAPLPMGPQAIPEGPNAEMESRGDKWSLEDDHKLVEIVLEKVKNMDLSKEVWEDCVRNLPGRNYNSVSSRWKSLIRRDKIGLSSRATRSRGKLHGTW